LYFTAVDGWAARKFNQVSKFGAWFDVVIDNIGRGILWTRISSVKRNIL
jgi:phosphatidylglycerophosphate synthase